MILAEPQSLLTPASKMPGLDGQKMSKSYNNTIALREPIDDVAGKISTMPTDPAHGYGVQIGRSPEVPGVAAARDLL